MKFSILVANYNNGKYFRDCYDSIIAQSRQNYEVIIVDDYSTDNSVQLIREIIGDDPRFKIFENDRNYGCGYTKRKCVEKATGEICAFLDPDDTITSTALEKMVTIHTQHPEISMAHSKFINTDEFLNPKQLYQSFKKVRDNDAHFFNFDGEISHFATFKRSFYDLTTGIDAHLQRAVDQDLYLKLYEAGPTYFLDEVLYNYRRISTGISTGDNFYKAYYWRWVVTMDAAKRRNINLENLFYDKIREKFVIPKTKPFEESFAFKVFRIENKIKKWFRGK